MCFQSSELPAGSSTRPGAPDMHDIRHLHSPARSGCECVILTQIVARSSGVHTSPRTRIRRESRGQMSQATCTSTRGPESTLAFERSRSPEGSPHRLREAPEVLRPGPTPDPSWRAIEREKHLAPDSDIRLSRAARGVRHRRSVVREANSEIASLFGFRRAGEMIGQDVRKLEEQRRPGDRT